MYTFAKWTIDYMKWAYNIKVCVTKIKIMAKIMTEKSVLPVDLQE